MLHEIRHHNRLHHGRLLSRLAMFPLALAATLAVHDARAAGFQLQEDDTQGMGHAFAGSTAAPGDCAVVVNNPAAMTEFKAQCLQIDITAINFGTHFHGSGTDALGDPLRGNNGGDGGATVPIPAIHYILPLGDRFAVGAAVSVPYGFQTEYHDQWVGRYQAETTKLQSPAVTISGSWKVADQFSIGLSLVAQRTSAKLSQAVNLGTILMQPTGGQLMPQGADAYAQMEGHDWAYGWGLGLLWKPTDSDRFGFDFRSQIDHHISGNATFLVPSNVQPLFGGAFVSTTGEAAMNTPYYASADWWHTFNEHWSLGAGVVYTHWSSFKSLDIAYANPLQAPYSSTLVFDYRNTWYGAVGGEYHIDDKWTLRAGVAYDQTPTVNAYREPRVPDGNRRILTLGAGFKVNDSLRFDIAYMHLWVSDAYIHDVSPTFDSLNGYFSDRGDLISVSGQFTF